MSRRREYFFQAKGGSVVSFPPDGTETDEAEARDYARRHNLRVIARDGTVVVDYTDEQP